MAYFLYSPFPWDLKRLPHLIGFFDALAYMYLSICVWRNRYSIWKDPVSRILLYIFILYIFVHGWGVGNFGTGIRHRTKFVVILIVLAASKFPKIIFLKKLTNV